jgi:predicted ribosomally synthesized peptide with nif11-like leader
MSKSELARFVADLGTDSILQSSVKTNTANPTALVAIARSKGYAIDLEEMRNHLEAGRPDLTEKQLDAVAGGKSASKIVIGAVPPLV